MTGRRAAPWAGAECVAAGVALALVLHLWMLLAGHISPAVDPGAEAPVASAGEHAAACPSGMSACRVTAPEDPVRPLPATLLVAALPAALLPRRPHRVEPAATPRDERGPPRSPGPAAVVLLE